MSIPNSETAYNATSNSFSNSIFSADILPFYFLSIERFEIVLLNLIVWIVNFFSNSESIQLISVRSLRFN